MARGAGRLIAAHRAGRMIRQMTLSVVRAFGVTDVGSVRSANEDSFTMADLSKPQRWQGGAPAEWPATEKGVLLVVSDGMGGAKAGEVASALSVEAVLGGMLRAVREKPADGETLRRVIEQASDKVHEAAKRPDRKGMGATLTAVLIDGVSAYVAQIGDSRAYLLRDGKMGQVTHDQSYVQLLVDAGIMTPAEAETSPRKNIILQVMGQEEVRVALGRVTLKRGDRLLLCSDGLTNVVDDATINAVAKSPADLAKASAALISLTKEGGAPDNVTVILGEVA
jgi:PPM family protein phosphatase